MTDQLIALSGAIVGLVGGGFVGYALGRRYRTACARGRFWVASVLSVLLGMGVMFLGLVTSVSFVAGGGVGLMTGGLNGLRWGMGRLSDVPRTPSGEEQGEEPRPERPAPGGPPDHPVHTS